MHLSPDPDFEEFAFDCIRLSSQEKSPILRRKLLTLARVDARRNASTGRGDTSREDRTDGRKLR